MFFYESVFYFSFAAVLFISIQPEGTAGKNRIG